MRDIEAVLFDLDGTIYIGEQLVDGAKEIIDHIRDRQKRIAFLTNNSTKTRAQIQEKLNKLGIEAALNDVYTSSFSTAEYLSENRITDVYCLGTASFAKELLEQGIRVVKDASATCVVIGMTNEIGAERLAIIREIASKPDSLIIACNLDLSYPNGSGEEASGCGKVVEAVEQAIDRKADLVIGKPFPFMLDAFTRDSGISEEHIIVVGDSVDSDMELAKRNGCIPVLLGDRPLHHEDCIVIEHLEQIEELLKLPLPLRNLIRTTSEEQLIQAIMSPYRSIFGNLKPFYIFGAQQLGAKIYEQSKAAGFEIKGFIDNDKRKQGKPFVGIPVLPLEECNREANILIASTTYLGDIQRQLVERKYSNNIPFTVLNLFDPEVFKSEPVFTDMHKDLFDNRFKYISLFLMLKENKSKKVLTDILKSRMDFEFHELHYDADNHYFEDDMIALGESEIFIDGGGYSGDTSEAFIRKTEGRYKEIHIFEPDQGLLKQARINLEGLPNIFYHEKGLSSLQTTVFFNQTGGLDGSISQEGNQKIEVTTLDAEVQNCATFIKLDIEGAEEDALKGAVRHLVDCNPKLAIACYHKASDLWKLPKTIMDSAQGYEFYFRHYSQSVLETVLYGVKRK